MNNKSLMNEIRMNICTILLELIFKISPLNENGHILRKHILNYSKEAVKNMR